MDGETSPRGSDPPGVKVSRIKGYPADVKLRSVLLLGIEWLTVDLGPGHSQQSGLETESGFSGLVSALEGECFPI